jgi:hypothetical protein
MKKAILAIVILVTLGLNFNESNAQGVVRYTYTRPAWTVGFGPAWNLATNDAYGRAIMHLRIRY